MFAPISAAQNFPDPATVLKQRLAEFAAPFALAQAPDATLPELAATIVCLVEALNVLPEGVKYEMLQAPDFEDALDLAVGYAERPAFQELGIDLEDNLENCL